MKRGLAFAKVAILAGAWASVSWLLPVALAEPTQVRTALRDGAQPGPAWEEEAHYRIGYSLVGKVGNLTTRYRTSPAAPLPIEAEAFGSGGFLGIGETEKHINSHLGADLAAGTWTTVFRKKAGTTIYTNIQNVPGVVLLSARRKKGRDDQRHLRRKTPIMDPAGSSLAPSGATRLPNGNIGARRPPPVEGQSQSVRRQPARPAEDQH